MVFRRGEAKRHQAAQQQREQESPSGGHGTSLSLVRPIDVRYSLILVPVLVPFPQELLLLVSRW